VVDDVDLGRWTTGIAGSNFTRSMNVFPLFVCVVLSCVGRGVIPGIREIVFIIQSDTLTNSMEQSPS
jgi:hypothetical protein